MVSGPFYCFGHSSARGVRRWVFSFNRTNGRLVGILVSWLPLPSGLKAKTASRRAPKFALSRVQGSGTATPVRCPLEFNYWGTALMSGVHVEIALKSLVTLFACVAINRGGDRLWPLLKPHCRGYDTSSISKH